MSCDILGAAWPHGRRDVSDGVFGVPHRRQRLTGSNLHHLGPQQALLRHTAQRAQSARLGSVHQRTDGKFVLRHAWIRETVSVVRLVYDTTRVCVCTGRHRVLRGHLHSRVEHQRQPHRQRQHLHRPQPADPLLLRVGDERVGHAERHCHRALRWRCEGELAWIRIPL